MFYNFMRSFIDTRAYKQPRTNNYHTRSYTSISNTRSGLHPQGLINDYVLGLNTGSNPKYMIILCMITLTLKIPRMSAFYVKNNYIAIVKVNATLIFPRMNYFD